MGQGRVSNTQTGMMSGRAKLCWKMMSRTITGASTSVTAAKIGNKETGFAAE